MNTNMLNNSTPGKRAYVSPSMVLTQVRLEEGICGGDVVSGQPTQLNMNNQKVQVEEYKEITNEVSFD